MPPTTPPKVKTKFTNTTGEKVTVMTDGTKTRVPAVPPTSIPSAVTEGTTKPLDIPQPKLDTVNAASAVTTAEALTGSIQEQEAARAAQETAAAQTKVDTSETAIRDANATLGTESAKRTELETAAGLPGANKRLQELTTGLASATANLRQFDLDFATQMEQTRVDMGKRDLTKRTFNAASAEANTQMAVQRAGMVANVYAQQASIQILSDNVKAATESVDKALTSFYEPIRQEMEMEKMFFQRNAISFDESRNREATARMKVIEQKQSEIDRAINLSDSAVASGYASAEDIEKMTSLSGNPKAQAEYAQTIVAKGAREMMVLDRMAKNASINASNMTARKNLTDLAIAGDPQAIAQLGYDPGAPIRAKAEKEDAIVKAQLDKTLSAQIDKQNDIISRLTKVAGMTNAINASTGVAQNGFLTGMRGTTETMKVGDQEIEIGTGSLTIASGFKGMQDKGEFLTQMNYLLAGEGFQQFSKLKDEGVNLTPVSELEFNKIMASANMLSSAAETKDGKIVGFGNLAPEVVVREINTMIAGAAVLRDEKAAIKALGEEGYYELLTIQQGQ